MNQFEARAKDGFFAVDSRTWAKLCVPGMMNEAVAYLILARGSGPDNRTSTWSVQAIETIAASRATGAAAVKNLQEELFTRLLRGGTNPKYELIPYGAPQYPRTPLSALAQRAFDLIEEGEEITSAQSEYQAACRAASKGWLVRATGKF